MAATDNDDLVLVYDGDCPMCNAYCRMVRIREAAGDLRLYDAREGGPIVEDLTARGLDVDEGMVLIAGEQLYYGSDAIHALSLMSSRSGFFNRLNYLVFKSKTLSAVLYPVLKAGRNLLLKMLGRSRINNLGLADNERF
ncbi:MAG: DUF393 domain-containing protein [Gammaproteobacteria bacterium]|nr:DUF393 domain-containing protein [Gammaproteobacteria bacterium]NND60349.1 DUF393 domain-containing protein [Gammaproteobacteria bacterium]